MCVGSAAGEVGGVASGPQYVSSKGGLHAMVKWLGTAQDVAAFLASPAAGCMTGAVVDVNGGFYMG